MKIYISRGHSKDLQSQVLSSKLSKEREVRAYSKKETHLKFSQAEENVRTVCLNLNASPIIFPISCEI